MNYYYWKLGCAENSTVSDVGKMINASFSNFFPFGSALLYIAMWIVIKLKKDKVAPHSEQHWKKNVSSAYT